MAASSSRVLVTAFGPFGGRSRNASLLALRGLKQSMPWIRTRVLPVDAELGPMRLRKAIRELRPKVLVMLGEAGGSHEIRLETTAWNELDFRIPDAAGRQPRGIRIRENTPDLLKTTLPLDRLLDALTAEGHPVKLSEDAGRYLCNQVFFDAMHSLSRWSIGCTAGFVHLPLENDYATPRVVAALEKILAELARR